MAGSIFFALSAQGATVRLPAAPFNWANAFGIAGGDVKTEPGGIIAYNVPVFDIDPDPNEVSPEQIGNLDFQFMLWTASSAGPNGVTDTFGASIFGGFNLTDTDDAGTRFAFLQIYTDNSFPNGKVDGGGWQGKTNGDIPGYGFGNGNWNYAGTQYDYLDNPFDRSTRLPNNGNTETVSFETALDCYTDTGTLSILSDFTWGFTVTNNNGNYTLTGTGPAQQASASNSLINLYTNPNNPPGPSNGTPGLTQNAGVGSCHVNATATQPTGSIPTDITPEPSSWLLFCSGVALIGAFRRNIR
jgi:hypothetical protein